MQLNFYSYGIVLRKQNADGSFTEHAVDPTDLVNALTVQPRMSTGLLSSNTLYYSSDGTKRVVVEYRPPQFTGIYIDGSDQAVRVPLPGLIMIRCVANGTPDYGIFAVHERPASLDARLYAPPLPNMYTGGRVCWGSVPRIPKNALDGNDLTEDWKLYLGSTFTNHAVDNKSKKYSKDCRLMLFEVEKSGASEYPVDDLVSSWSLKDALRRVENGTGIW